MKNLISSGEQIAEQFMRPFNRFFHKEASSSILLLSSTVIALVWANSPFSPLYYSFWHTKLSLTIGPYSISKDLLHWINDGIMAFFFFTIGLEIKREILVGELSLFRKAILPAAAAFGGMLFPALIFLIIGHGTAAVKGWGIPMATDIAFAIGALALLGQRIPLGLRVFLLAFAIADDLGAVLVIALFYTKTISWNYLLISLLFVGGLALANFLWIRRTLVYAFLGIGLWLVILGSGVHATIAGIVVAMFIPARGKYDTDRFIAEVGTILNEFKCGPSGCGYSILLNQDHLNAVQSIELAAHHAETPLQRLEHSLHPWVAFGVIPLFALANAGVTITATNIFNAMTSPLTLGIAIGLLLGKPLGITLFSYLSVKIGMASLPSGVKWSHIIGAGILGGIGFTMSLFIMSLSFTEDILLDLSKLGILAGSLISGILGLAFLRTISNTETQKEDKISKHQS